ncbi:MAG: DUF92 domain-containing protein [Anaerolineales bacterium]
MATLVMGALLGAAIAYLAYRAKALTAGGAAAAAGVGAATFAGGGLAAAVLMVIFFTSATVLTRLGWRAKRIAESGYAKGGRRDAAQVLANGGVAAALSAAFGLEASSAWWAGIVGALAAATADTWATELGGLSRVWPRRITSGERVPPGTSGGVTPLGLAGAAAGAGLIGVSAAWLRSNPSFGLIAVVAGTSAALFDSLLGATLQGMYFCPACGEETEQFPRHRCGSPTRHHRGIRQLDNDGVNLLATAFGAAVAMGVGILPSAA